MPKVHAAFVLILLRALLDEDKEMPPDYLHSQPRPAASRLPFTITSVISPAALSTGQAPKGPHRDTGVRRVCDPRCGLGQGQCAWPPLSSNAKGPRGLPLYPLPGAEKRRIRRKPERPCSLRIKKYLRTNDKGPRDLCSYLSFLRARQRIKRKAARPFGI